MTRYKLQQFEWGFRCYDSEYQVSQELPEGTEIS